MEPRFPTKIRDPADELHQPELPPEEAPKPKPPEKKTEKIPAWPGPKKKKPLTQEPPASNVPKQTDLPPKDQTEKPEGPIEGRGEEDENIHQIKRKDRTD